MRNKKKSNKIDNSEYEFVDELCSILKTYKDGSEEPLDGDAVDDLTEHLRDKLNLMEGNITRDEYMDLECEVKNKYKPGRNNE